MAIDVTSAFLHPELGQVSVPTRGERAFGALAASAKGSQGSATESPKKTDAVRPLPGIEINKDAPAGQQDGRRLLGEFVGTTFYGILFRQLRQSEFKGKYMHGGRGEEVFQAQLDQELAKRIGESPNDPIANKMYEAFRQRLPDGSPEKAAVGSKAKSIGGISMAFVPGDGDGKVTMLPRGIEMYRAAEADKLVAGAARMSSPASKIEDTTAVKEMAR